MKKVSEYWVFLEKLRRSGVTNMYGAGPYLESAFGLSSREARAVLVDWMKNYDPDDYGEVLE